MTYATSDLHPERTHSCILLEKLRSLLQRHLWTSGLCPLLHWLVSLRVFSCRVHWKGIPAPLWHTSHTLFVASPPFTWPLQSKAGCFLYWTPFLSTKNSFSNCEQLGLLHLFPAFWDFCCALDEPYQCLHANTLILHAFSEISIFHHF